MVDERDGHLFERLGQSSGAPPGRAGGQGRQGDRGRPQPAGARRTGRGDPVGQARRGHVVALAGGRCSGGQIDPQPGQPGQALVADHAHPLQQVLIGEALAERGPGQSGDRGDRSPHRLVVVSAREHDIGRGAGVVGGRVVRAQSRRQLGEQPEDLGLERAGLRQHGGDAGRPGGAHRSDQRGAQPAAELGLELLRRHVERPQQPAVGLLGGEIAPVGGEYRGGEGLGRRQVGGVLVRVIVQQHVDVVGQPRGEPPAQGVDEIRDRQLQLGGQPLAVDRLGPEALLGLGVDDAEQHHPAVVAGLTGQRRDERRERQLPRQRLALRQHPHGHRRRAGSVAVHVDPRVERVEPVARAGRQEGVEQDRRLERARRVRVQDRPRRAGVDGRPVLLGRAHRHSLLHALA